MRDERITPLVQVNPDVILMVSTDATVDVWRFCDCQWRQKVNGIVIIHDSDIVYPAGESILSQLGLEAVLGVVWIDMS